MQYQILTEGPDCLINIFPDAEGKELLAFMLCRTPAMFGDALFIDSIYPDTFRGSTKEEAVDFFKEKVKLGARILKCGWVVC